MRLVRDDVPVRGRVLDTQGRPVGGVTVRITELVTPEPAADLDKLLASGQLGYDQTLSRHWWPTWLTPKEACVTDSDGRFEVRGVGRDRIVGLELSGPRTEKIVLRAMARPSTTKPKTHPRPSPDRFHVMNGMPIGRPPAPTLEGATFEVIAGPTRPIAGVVRLQGSGTPLAGVKVYGIEATSWTQVDDTTDAEGRFRLVGLPKAGSYNVRAAPEEGRPYIRNDLLVTDTQGLGPIETVLELPRGIPVTGRVVDAATGKAVLPMHVNHIKLPSNQNDGHSQMARVSLTEPTFILTVPPGPGMFYANVHGTDSLYSRARLRPEDRGKGVGGIGDQEATTIPLSAYHAYKIVDVPADVDRFSVELEATRGLSRRGRVIDPDGKTVMGAQAYGLVARWGTVKTLDDGTFEALGLEPGHPRRLIFTHRARTLTGSVTLTDADLKSDAAARRFAWNPPAW